ncbi:ribosomal protein S18-alanine N-acetyltransferase [Nocardioides panacisoli]|uniref:[Ribosomal protein bS18]-alanine N-acetyltransferase n=1 Tax=Nocardioides panacisoli TaxID=627624 RepID=A0ABP7IFF7_9ACTN
MTIEVRPATPDDVEPIATLDNDSFAIVWWSREMTEQGVTGQVPGLSYLVAEHRDAFVGYAAVSVVDDVAELQRIAVLPAARRLGAGVALTRAAADHARQQGAERILLEVREENDAARALYAGTGFREIARRKRYFRDGADALVLERRLV